MIFNKEKFNWYGLDHDKARQKYGDLDGRLEYIGTFCIEGSYKPHAVYYAPNPNRSEGHKTFILFSQDPVYKSYFVTGRSLFDMLPYLKQDGIYCESCKEVIYSVMRHDMRYCYCKKTFVDGGREYLITNDYGVLVTINFWNNKIERT